MEQEYESDENNCFQPLMRLVSLLLHQFIKGHFRLQVEVFDSIDVLIGNLAAAGGKDDVGIQLVLQKVFENNQEVSDRVNYTEVLHAVGFQIIGEHPRRNPGWLRVMGRLTVVNDAVVPLVKNTLVSMFRDSRWSKVIAHYGESDHSSERLFHGMPFSELKRQIRDFCRTEKHLQRQVFGSYYDHSLAFPIRSKSTKARLRRQHET